MSANVAPVLTEVTNFLLETLRSTDPRRFAMVHKVSRVATKLIQATSLRVEDFEDAEQFSKKRNGLFLKDRDTTPVVLVPEELAPTSVAVLAAMTAELVKTLESDRVLRFTEVERVTECALNFILSVTPRTDPKTSDAVRVINCDDPEGAYIQDAQDNPPRDTNQLRREILEIEGTDSQIRAELALAKIATEEAAELAHLVAAQKDGGALDLVGPVADRIAQLRAKIAFRTKGENGVVSADVSRGHQPRGEGARDDDSQGDTDAAERAQGARRVA